MAGSYEGINYSLRPAKQVERKMICEAIRRLTPFASIESYRYVGFGSIYFSDFAMFHRRLNISQMLSIEKDEHKRERFEFNRPFECIQLEFGNSKEVLPKLDWSQRTIPWLDYDGRLDGDVLADVSCFCANATSGSMLLVSVNAHSDPRRTDKLEELRTALGKELVPIETEEADLAGWKMASMIRRIMTSWINKCINDRNGGKPSPVRFAWNQVMSFEYQDGAKMTTIGGVLTDAGHDATLSACGFSTLEFVRTADQQAYRIDIPALTYRELRRLDQVLPSSSAQDIALTAIPKRDVANYARIYRYFPTFAEADL